MVLLNPAINISSHNIEEILRDFNIGTFEIMSEYKSQEGKRDKKLRELCDKNKILLQYPKKAGEKVIDFIKYYINS